MLSSRAGGGDPASQRAPAEWRWRPPQSLRPERVVLAVTIIVIGVAAIAASTQSASRAAAETELQRLETGKTWAQREGKWLTVFYQASTTNK